MYFHKIWCFNNYEMISLSFGDIQTLTTSTGFKLHFKGSVQQKHKL